MAQPKLIADEGSIRRLLKDRQFPQDGFRINVPTEEMAQLLYNCYVAHVIERGRHFIASDDLERRIWQVAEMLTLPTYRFGLMLTGGCGNGKTTMMRAIRTAVHDLYVSRNSAFCAFPGFRTEIPLVSAKEMVGQILEERKTYASTDILMIDDLGHEPVEVMRYGMIHTPIVDLLEARYARQKYTIISTNLKISEIRPRYMNRLADRFNEMMHFVEFEDGTYRG